MKKKFFLCLSLLLVIQLQIIYPVPVIAQSVTETTSEIESSNRSQEPKISGTNTSEMITDSSSISVLPESDSNISKHISDNSKNQTKDSTLEQINLVDDLIETQPRSKVTLTETTTKGTWGKVTWSFDNSSGTLTFTGTGELGESTTSPWNQSTPIPAASIKKIVFTKSVNAPANSAYLFSSSKSTSNQLKSLTSIDGITNLNTTSANNMSYMFFNVSSIVALDLSTFNTDKGNNFYSMFDGATSLEELNISNFNTQGGSTRLMFNKNNQLKKLTLGSKFKGVDTRLPAISHSHGYSGNWMNLATNTYVGSSDNFIANYNGTEPGTYVWQKQLWNDVPWDFTDGVLTFLDTGIFNGSKNSPWNRTDELKISAADIKSIVFTKPVTAPTDSSYLFSSSSSTANQLKSLISIEGVSNLDTSQVQNMSYMFYNTSSILKLDLSTFNTDKVNNFYAMFGGASKLQELNMSNFNNTQLKSTTQMFLGTNQLNKLILGSKFRANGDTKLPTISHINGYSGNWINQSTNVSVGSSSEFMKNYDGSSPGTYVWQKQLWNNVPWDFKDGVLTFLDSGSFNEYTNSPWNRTDELKINAADIKLIIFSKPVIAPSSSAYLFSSVETGNRLTSLTNIKGIDNLDTKQVTSMSHMFYGMSSILSLDLSTFNTDKVTNFYAMFYDDSSLAKLDISNFNTQGGSTKYMFVRNTKLSELTLGSQFRGKETGLPDVPNNDRYNGTWEYTKNDQSVGNSTEFMANYDGQNPGKYVWGSKDPLDPTDPSQNQLLLKSVPTAYSFKSGLFLSDYKIDGSVNSDNQVVVYNDRMDRNWSVKASVVGNQLTLKDGTSTIPVDSFTINSSNILDTKTKGIVASSPTDKTVSNNVGDVKTDVSNVSIGFTDTNNELKAGSELKGTIRYQLYNTADAE